MRSGWPHTQDDHGSLPAGRQQAFSPEISWPTGYSGLEYRDGDYRYPAPPGVQPYAAQPPAGPAPAGEHPYAAFGGNEYGPGPGVGAYAQPDMDAFGYGDPGYSSPSYDGPAAQDLGIAGTRTVSGFVESSHAGANYGAQNFGGPNHAGPNYGPNYGAPNYGAPNYGPNYGGPNYGGAEYAQPAQGPAYALPPGHQSGAYPAIDAPGEVQPYQQPYQANEPYQANDMYQQPWDYEQPLRYEGEESAYPAGPATYGAPVHEAPAAYSPADYNGSEYSMPGINGMGYDLSEIIHTGEFPEIEYDQPSYGRLSYDDPRYDNGARYEGGQGNQTRFDMPALDGFDARNPLGAPQGRGDTRFDMPALDSFDDFDDARLDHVWPAAEDLPGDAAGYDAAGYEEDGFGGVTPDRFGNTEDPRGLVGFSRRLSETRFDMPAIPDGAPARFDETRIDGMRALTPETEFGQAGPGLLTPADEQPMNWADETSLDNFEAVDARQVAPLAFRSPELADPRLADPRLTETGARRAIGKRRGRSGDKRQWMALGAIAVVAAGAIGMVVLKFAHSGPGGPAHSVSTPNTAGKFNREPNLEQQMKVSTLASEITKQSSGQASNVVSAVYQEGSSAPGSNPQTFIFVGGKLANGDPAASVTQFDQQYRGAHVVSPAAGSLTGEAACGEATANGESVAMCVWFDNDTFGDLVSSTMSPSSLASTMTAVRPSLEKLTQ
ncbi:MAG: hypothetical protein ACRDN0_27400 [Trebonia sp.]